MMTVFLCVLGGVVLGVADVFGVVAHMTDESNRRWR